MLNDRFGISSHRRRRRRHHNEICGCALCVRERISVTDAIDGMRFFFISTIISLSIETKKRSFGGVFNLRGVQDKDKRFSSFPFCAECTHTETHSQLTTMWFGLRVSHSPYFSSFFFSLNKHLYTQNTLSFDCLYFRSIAHIQILVVLSVDEYCLRQIRTQTSTQTLSCAA